LKKDYNKEFDGKMEELKNNKRTMSQTLDSHYFQEIREGATVLNGSCNTVIQGGRSGEIASKISGQSASSLQLSGHL